MIHVIRHPARLDLFDTGQREWGQLSQSRHFASDIIAGYFCEPGDVIMPLPDTQPIHPLTTTP